MEIAQSAKTNNGLIVKIAYDSYDQNPWEDNDFLGHWIAWHTRYNIGKKEDQQSQEEFEEYVKELKGKILVLNLYMYDHSGISFSLNRNYPFNDRWDAGQIGYIYVTYEELRKEFNVKRITKKLLDKAINTIKGEVETINSIESGEVYGYIVYKGTTCNCCTHTEYEHEDSCWGYVGDIKHIKEEISNMGNEFKDLQWQDGDNFPEVD